MSRSDASTEPRSDPDDLKQDLDEDLSQIVHEYQERGLSPTEIIDSFSWHAELAAAQPVEVTVGEYVDE